MRVAPQIYETAQSATETHFGTCTILLIAVPMQYDTSYYACGSAVQYCSSTRGSLLLLLEESTLYNLYNQIVYERDGQ